MHQASETKPKYLLIKPAILDAAVWLPVLLLAVTIPSLALRRDQSSGLILGDVNFQYAALIYFMIGLLAIIHLRYRIILLNSITKIDYLLIGFIIFCFFQSIYFQSIHIFFQSSLLGLIFISLRVASFSPRYEKFLSYTSIAIVVFIIYAFMTLGPPVDRWLGGIHPNLLGASLVAAVGLSLFGPKLWRDFVLIIALIAAASVSSRYAFATCLLIYILFNFFNYKSVGIIRLSIIIFFIAIAVIDLAINPYDAILADIFKLNDQARGVGSGVTGRDDHWIMFWPQFNDNPILGYGFRNRQAYFGAHNGFLDLILQSGVIGTSFFIIFYVTRIFLLTYDLFFIEDHGSRGRFLSIILGTFFAAQLQPQLINFGDPMGILTLICLFGYRSKFEKGNK